MVLVAEGDAVQQRSVAIGEHLRRRPGMEAKGREIRGCIRNSL